MSRPKPTILLEYIDQKTYMADQVLEAAAIYSVFYQGKPINLRSQHHLISTHTPKYLKTSFSNAGHAFNLCEKLNEKFKTNEFSVVQLDVGTPITEGKRRKRKPAVT